MTKLVSDCCGVEINVMYVINPNKMPLVYDENDYAWECSKCHKPCQLVQGKEER